LPIKKAFTIAKEVTTRGMDDLRNSKESLTSIREASGDKGFPSSQTTKSETSSTTPVNIGKTNDACPLARCIYTKVTKHCNKVPLFNRTGMPCFRRKGSISCVNCSKGPSLRSTYKTHTEKV